VSTVHSSGVWAPDGANTPVGVLEERKRYRAPWWLVVLALATVTVVSIPLLYLVVRVWGLPLENVASIFQRPRVGELAWNTISLSVAVTATTLVLGTAFAAVISRIRVGIP